MEACPKQKYIYHAKIYQQQSAEILVSNAMQRVSTRSLFVDKNYHY